MTANSYQLSVSLNFFDASNAKWPTPLLSITAPGLGLYSQPAVIQPGDSYTFFSGQRSTASDSTTVYTMTLSPIPVDPIYRFTHSAGTAPVLRTARAVDLSPQTITVTLNTNETVTVTASSGSFSSAQVGDSVFIPGVATGDSAGPFSETNVGWWVVLSKSSTTLTMCRRTGESFSGTGESVTVAAAGDFQVMSPGPVQRGDGVDVIAGFTAAILRSYTVREVAPTWFEIVASDPLPTSEVGTATATPPRFYTAAKRLVWLLVDQEASVAVNGADPIPVSPVVAGHLPGPFIWSGPVYSLVATNRSAQELNALARGIS